MANRAYYFRLVFESGDLKQVTEKPAAAPGLGATAADLLTAEARALVAIRARMAREFGAGPEAVWWAAWTDDTVGSYPAAVPIQIRELAQKLGSARVWRMLERFHGREKKDDDDKKRRQVPTSVNLIREADALWNEIVATSLLFYDDGTSTDLVAASDEEVLGISSPTTGLFYGDTEDRTFSGAGIFNLLEGAG